MTTRVIWPLAIAYLDTVDLVVAWCELGDDFRTFRLDRFLSASPIEDSFRPNRVPKLRIFLDRMAEERCNDRRESTPADRNTPETADVHPLRLTS